MSSPRITPRPQRIIRTERDPYQPFYPPKSRGIALIYRNVYEDGTVALFVGAAQVRSIRRDDSRFAVLLNLGDDFVNVPLFHVDPDEEQWLLESLRRPSQ